MWVLNPGAPGAKPGSIYPYEYDITSRLFSSEWPARMTQMGVWELMGAVVKTQFGVSIWKGMGPLVLDGDGVELSARSSASPPLDLDGDLYPLHPAGKPSTGRADRLADVSCLCRLRRRRPPAQTPDRDRSNCACGV